MKSDLGLRPFDHRKNVRIEAHLFLSILAFHVAHLIRSKLRRHQIHSSWAMLKVKLNHQSRVTMILPQKQMYGNSIETVCRSPALTEANLQSNGAKIGQKYTKNQNQKSAERRRRNVGSPGIGW